MSTLIRSPGLSQRPGYYETVVSTETIVETVRVCQQEPIFSVTTIIVGGGEPGVGERIIVPGPVDDAFVASQPNGTTVTFIVDTGETHTVCHEENITREIEVSEQVVHDGGWQSSFESGWDAGADSLSSLDGDGGFQFSILDTSIGVYCGLSRASLNVLPLEINYAFYCSGGFRRYTTVPNGVTGSFTSQTVFAIHRLGTRLLWTVDGILIDQRVVDDLPSSLWADASLYATGDTVVDATFIDAIPFTEPAGASTLPMLESSGASVIGAAGVGKGKLPRLSSGGIGTPYVLVTSGNWTLPVLVGAGYVVSSGYGKSTLPALTSDAYAFDAATASGTLPALVGAGYVSTNGYGKNELPALTGAASAAETATASGTLRPLVGVGFVGANGYGQGTLPFLTSEAFSLDAPEFVIGWGSLPVLVGYSYGVLLYDQTGSGAGALPALRSKAGDTLNGYSDNLLPALTGRAWVKTNTGVLVLSTPENSSYGGTENWDGLCFYDPIYLSLAEGMCDTWLTNAENRIETYFGLLGSNTRTITVQRNYNNVSGVLAYLATYYVLGTPDRFDLVTDLLDFVRPSRTSAGVEIDRILAHEMTHAVMNDRINTTSWPGWFSEGLCEFIHGAVERVNQCLMTESISSLLSALNDNVSGHAQMTSRHYAAGYLAVWKLHSVTTGGIKTLLLDMATGTSLNNTIINNTTFGSVADFLVWMTGSNGTLFVQGLQNSNAFSGADTGAIGGYAVDGGSILDNFSVIPD